MGGSQSSGTVTSQLFNYDCNPHVSMFISNNQQHLEELKRVIEDYAELKNIANGQVQLTGKKVKQFFIFMPIIIYFWTVNKGHVVFSLLTGVSCFLQSHLSTLAFS